MNYSEIGKRLVNLRGKKTREEVAYKTGISSASLFNYENGIRVPKDEVKIKLADFYGLTVQELFFPDQGKDKKKSTH